MFKIPFTIPCRHLDLGRLRCIAAKAAGVVSQKDCHGCAAYDPVIADDERTQCEIWTRVMGYHRPVSSWNTGKQAEYAERKPFAEPA